MSSCSGTDGYPTRLPLKITSHLALCVSTCSGLPPGTGRALCTGQVLLMPPSLCRASAQQDQQNKRPGVGRGASQSSEPLGIEGTG